MNAYKIEAHLFASIPCSSDMDSIDYSPHPSVKKTTLVLHDGELQTATHHQFVRFLRVWCVESHTYAPHLESLTIILRPSIADDGSVQIVGINKFLQYAMEYKVYESEEVSIYIDEVASRYDG